MQVEIFVKEAALEAINVVKHAKMGKWGCPCCFIMWEKANLPDNFDYANAELSIQSFKLRNDTPRINSINASTGPPYLDANGSVRLPGDIRPWLTQQSTSTTRHHILHTWKKPTSQYLDMR